MTTLSIVREKSNEYRTNIKTRSVDETHISKSVWLIHLEALAVAQDIKRCETRMLEILRRLDETGGYREFQCTSLYAYCIDFLKLTENVALNWIAIMRRGKEVPELIAAVNEGRISASVARKMTSVINPENKLAWLALAEISTVQQIEKAVAKVAPKTAVHESMKYINSERLQFSVGVTEEWRELLTRLKDILSQASQRAVDSEEALFVAMSRYISLKDPLEKARRSVARRAKAHPNIMAEDRSSALHRSSGEIHEPSKVSSLSSYVRHVVMLRDAGQCTEVDGRGIQCSQKRWLDFHHVVPKSQGGRDTAENLRLLCRAHHREIHQTLKGGMPN
jgi:5-methylcytosine-specific restriction endonuclease McrA